ncbi:hypothetical protein [Rhizobium sp. RU36D]|uniref:hypothetical protein n=1 Tax=Rhizobium sp. RU36D TaxID=1907415 RepID=UPI0009D7DAA2|nr:hypothetical protein [Rhizobium sp. RU36D]SMD10943.1 hypothetical protein SAMN05880593_12238 [Rhizobium sp. RU36D]
MASPLIIAAFTGALASFGPQGMGDGQIVRVAGDCSAAASQVVAQTGGELLSAVPQGDACVITVLIPGNGSERPRKVTMRVPM